MTQEQKDLLLQDLCARLPYGVKVNTIYSNEHASFYRRRACKNGVNELNLNIMWLYHVQFEIDIKPYLFPLESMTEEQKEEFNQLIELKLKAINNEIDYTQTTVFEVDFYNKHHLDWRGFIEKSLAIDATNKSIY